MESTQLTNDLCHWIMRILEGGRGGIKGRGRESVREEMRKKMMTDEEKRWSREGRGEDREGEECV